MTDIINYYISFLLYGQSCPSPSIGYTDNPADFDRFDIIIRPNGHLGKDWVFPDLSTPSLSGKFITPDIIYNTAFFTSRAEELLTIDRDQHGRFCAQNSLLNLQNRLLIPIIDEYSRFLIKTIERTCDTQNRTSPVNMPQLGFSHIYLTHDIDTIAHYRHLRGFLGAVVRGQMPAAIAALRNINNDPAFTFPWLMQQDQRLPQATAIYFVKHTPGRGYDYPQYNLRGKDYRHLRQLLTQSGAQLGWHSSYYGAYPAHPQVNHRLHRSHYLRCSIASMQRLADLGVTDDFTMGFPDKAGFRLQTSRPVRWLNPITMRLTPLTLHPLTVMDCTLSNTNYMHLAEDEAFFYCQKLFEKVRQNSGELTLLWHNANPAANTYHFSLYQSVINLLTTTDKQS